MRKIIPAALLALCSCVTRLFGGEVPSLLESATNTALYYSTWSIDPLSGTTTQTQTVTGDATSFNFNFTGTLSTGFNFQLTRLSDLKLWQLSAVPPTGTSLQVGVMYPVNFTQNTPGQVIQGSFTADGKTTSTDPGWFIIRDYNPLTNAIAFDTSWSNMSTLLSGTVSTNVTNISYLSAVKGLALNPDINFIPVPEPETWAYLVIGLAVLLLLSYLKAPRFPTERAWNRR